MLPHPVTVGNEGYYIPVVTFASWKGQLASQIMSVVNTPPKFNIEPQNEGLEDDVPFQRGDFQVPC